MSRRRRRANGKEAERELLEARLRTAASRLRSRREYRTSTERLTESQRVAYSLSLQNSYLEQSTTRDHSRKNSVA